MARISKWKWKDRSRSQGITRGMLSRLFQNILNDPCLQVECHPQVVPLPAPHIWQLTPSLALQISSTTTDSSTSNIISNSLVVTCETRCERGSGR